MPWLIPLLTWVLTEVRRRHLPLPLRVSLIASYTEREGEEEEVGVEEEEIVLESIVRCHVVQCLLSNHKQIKDTFPSTTLARLRHCH